MKTLDFKIAKVMRAVVVSLIILASLSVISEGQNSTREAKSENAAFVEGLMINSVYNAADFANAEFALETENWMNRNGENNNEIVEAESALTIEALMFNFEYNAKEFVEAEMALAIESWIINYAETTNEDLAAEPALAIAKWMTNGKYNAAEFVNAELALEIENRKNENNYQNSLEEQIASNELAEN